MKVQWIIANDLGTDSDIFKFEESLKLNKNVILCPVSLEEVLTPSFIPTYDENIPTMIYGPVNFVTRMENIKKFKPGVFGNNELFSYRNMISKINSEWIFNSPSDTIIVKSKNIKDHYYFKNNFKEQLFFKPVDDSKFIAGQVAEKQYIIDFSQRMANNQIENVDGDTELLICLPYGIEEEYRLFVVDGIIVTHSMYNPKFQQKELSNEIIDFAKKVIKKWNPCPFFVLDICISNKNPYVMEIQNLHSAGHYDCDRDLLIEKINNYITTNY